MTVEDPGARLPQEPAGELEAYESGFLPPPEFARADRGTHTYVLVPDDARAPAEEAWTWVGKGVLTPPGEQGRWGGGPAALHQRLALGLQSGADRPSRPVRRQAWPAHDLRPRQRRWSQDRRRPSLPGAP